MDDEKVIDINSKNKNFDLQTLVEKDKQERTQKCYIEIQNILKKYNCKFDISVTLKTNSILPELLIVAN